MGIKFERGRLQNPEVEHLGTYSLTWEPEKLSIAKILCHIWYSPVLLLLFIADLLHLFISTVVGSVSAEFMIVYSGDSQVVRSFSGETKYQMSCIVCLGNTVPRSPSLFSLHGVHDAQIGLGHIAIGASMSEPHTEDCKLVVACKTQNRNPTDKLNPQCSKLALFANTTRASRSTCTPRKHYCEMTDNTNAHVARIV